MTDVPVTFHQVECNGDTPPESDEPSITKITEETSDLDGTSLYYRVEPSLEDLPSEGNQGQSETLQGNILLNYSTDEEALKENPEENLYIVHKAITDLSLQEKNVDEMTVKEGHQWEKIPLSSSNQDINRQKERIIEQPLEEREDDNGKNKDHHATEIEWLGFRKPSHGDVLHSKHEEQEVWDEEINDDDDDCNEEEDEVREIEFKKKREYSQLKEEGDISEDSPLSSPSSQPVTPDEQPALVKRGDISRNAYSRYNTISYRKIRKGNTKQRIDEFESMMNL
ncbi:PREDICTED: ermin [Condylura cristata]|uniref:ermin n=1 Tax=Condylura cristata TaxID=143302 RepID=UPI0003345AAB|nr:PREDICTED: ermin [Condylura cristata]